MNQSYTLSHFNYSFCDQNDISEANSSEPHARVLYRRIESLERVVEHQCDLQAQNQQLIESQAQKINKLQQSLSLLLSGIDPTNKGSMTKRNAHQGSNRLKETIKQRSSSMIEDTLPQRKHTSTKKRTKKVKPLLVSLEERRKAIDQELSKRLPDQISTSRVRLTKPHSLSSYQELR